MPPLYAKIFEAESRIWIFEIVYINTSGTSGWFKDSANYVLLP